MNIFEIKSSDGDGRLLFKGDVPRGLSGYDGCYFNVSMISTPLSASVRVYEIQPQSWSTFFEDIAANWKGWTGSKEKESLEGHLNVKATSDSLGHVSLHARLSDYASGKSWCAEDVVIVEAGQLDTIARHAKMFFG